MPVSHLYPRLVFMLQMTSTSYKGSFLNKLCPPPSKHIHAEYSYPKYCIAFVTKKYFRSWLHLFPKLKLMYCLPWLWGSLKVALCTTFTQVDCVPWGLSQMCLTCFGQKHPSSLSNQSCSEQAKWACVSLWWAPAHPTSILHQQHFPSEYSWPSRTSQAVSGETEIEGGINLMSPRARTEQLVEACFVK